VEYWLQGLHNRMIVQVRAGWLLAGALLCSLSGRAEAQHPLTEMGGFVLSAWAGGAANTDLQRVRARAEWLQPDGTLSTRTFSRRLGAEPTVAFAAGLAYWFNPWWGVRVQGSVSPSQLGILVSERETDRIPQDASVTGPARYGSLRVWTLDWQLLVRAPITPRGRIAPYGLIGMSRVEYDASPSEGLPPEALVFRFNDKPGRFGVVLGAGASIPLQREHLALGFELDGHISRTPVERPGEARLSGEQVEVITPASRRANSGEVGLTGHFRLLVGLSWFVR
jgi:hypothetical protein